MQNPLFPKCTKKTLTKVISAISASSQIDLYKYIGAVKINCINKMETKVARIQTTFILVQHRSSRDMQRGASVHFSALCLLLTFIILAPSRIV